MKKRMADLWRYKMALLVITAVLLWINPCSSKAATVKYPQEAYGNRYTIGKQIFLTETKEIKKSSGYCVGKTTLYQQKNGKKIKLAALSPSEEIRVRAKYGNWLYYVSSRYGADFNLYRYHLKTGKNMLVRENVGRMLIYKGRLYTQGYATDISNVPLYVSQLNGKKAKQITSKCDQSKMRAYGNSLYFMERTIKTGASYNEIINLRLVRYNLKSGKTKVLSKTIKNSSVVYFSKKILVYSKFAKELKYYQIDLKTKKEKRIYPSESKLTSWSKKMQ